MNKVTKKEPWEDAELQKMIKDLRKVSKHDQIRKRQKAIKEKRWLLKNKYYREAADNINSAAEARQVEKEFSLAKKHSVFKTTEKLRISNEKLQIHFQQHFAARELPEPPELGKPDQYPHLKDDTLPIDEIMPTEKEVKAVLKTFKNNKSSGTDKLKTECLKYNDSNKLTHQSYLSIIDNHLERDSSPTTVAVFINYLSVQER